MTTRSTLRPVPSSTTKKNTIDISSFVEKAKTLALNHAGLSAGEVSLSKAKFENDDGIMVYEIEFIKDRTEYEYTIDAASGKILEFDSEYDD